MMRTNLTQIPDKGQEHDSILGELAQLKSTDIAWKQGRVWSMVYYVDEAHQHLIEEAYSSCFSENYLNPFAFGSLKNMEQEVIRMTINLLNGNDTTTGVMTSGGTESIFLAVYTYRERARQLFPRIREPEMVISTTTHPAFEKAGHILNIKVRKAPVDDQLRAIPAEMAKLINKNTIFMAASAPSYPHGVLDPISQLSVIAQNSNLPFHVDGCIGGFMLPWVEKLGYPVDAFDFRLPGVTSMSADLHKFGYGAKGASVLLYQNMDYLKYQFFITTEWPGGIYASPTFMGSRPGGAIAAAWAALRGLGREGYLAIAEELMEGVKQLKKGLTELPEIQILGDPCMNIIAFNTKNNHPDIFVIADQLEHQGWMVDRQQMPNCIHLTVMRNNIPVINTYLRDLRGAILHAIDNPQETAQGNAALYGLMARIPFRGMVEKNVRNIFEQLYDFTKSGEQKRTSKDTNEETSPILAETPRWMGALNRFLAWWSRK
jgi:glutamate/tyrosine decarboxylase-like PLP-dependent enzyme